MTMAAIPPWLPVPNKLSSVGCVMSLCFPFPNFTTRQLPTQYFCKLQQTNHSQHISICCPSPPSTAKSLRGQRRYSQHLPNPAALRRHVPPDTSTCRECDFDLLAEPHAHTAAHQHRQQFRLENRFMFSSGRNL